MRFVGWEKEIFREFPVNYFVKFARWRMKMVRFGGYWGRRVRVRVKLFSVIFDILRWRLELTFGIEDGSNSPKKVSL